MAFEDRFHEKSPNGIPGSANRGAKIFKNLTEQQREIDIPITVKGVLEASKELENLEKQIQRVGKLKDEQAGADKADLEAYMNQLNKRYDEEKDRLDAVISKVEQKYRISIDSEKEILEYERQIREENEEIDNILAGINRRRADILADSSKSDDVKREELRNLSQEQRSYEILKRNNERELKPSDTHAEIEKALGGEDGTLGSILSFFNGGNEYGTSQAIDDIADTISVFVPEVGAAVEIAESIAGTVKLISDGLTALRSSMTKSINQAAATMASYYGRINANLVGSGMDYNSIADDVENALGFSRLIKQTDYLNQIADLTNQGLVTDLEQRALLQAIKDKTLTSFDVTNAGLTRLVRLGEQNSINQFGVELQLRRLLNSKIFGDASYLQNMFDSVTSAILDASVAGSGDITNFNSTVQTWLGAMYSSGLSDNVVSAIAQGINALGSGNVTALAQDESIQRLFLLSMDRVGLDYADLLQQGLSSDDTNKLLSSIVSYLNEIATNTSDNLVLKSSYSSLFNLSVSDMEAIQNVYSKIGDISSSIINSSDAQKTTVEAVSEMVKANTLSSEQFENFFANFSYSFGSGIAENNTLYTVYRMNDIAYDLLDGFSKAGGALGKMLGSAKLIPAAVQYAIGGASFMNMLSSANTFSSDSILNLLGSESSGSSLFVGTNTDTSSTFKTFKQTSTQKILDTYSADAEAWQAEADDEVLGVLKDMSKTLMKLKEGDGGYAFAVSVEGMSNEVLKSFASIFADEDAMMSTFTGDNTVLQKALFDYFDDTTSNSTEA